MIDCTYFRSSIKNTPKIYSMGIDEIKELISINLSHNILWIYELKSASPSHYGVDDLECILEPKNIWVDVSTGTFNFSDANLNFLATTGASSCDCSLEMYFTEIAKGVGRFKFIDGNAIQILDIKAKFKTHYS